MLGLRTRYGVDVAKFNRDFNADFDTEYKAALKKNANYLDRKGNILTIKDEYLYVQNGIITEFMEQR